MSRNEPCLIEEPDWILSDVMKPVLAKALSRLPKEICFWAHLRVMFVSQTEMPAFALSRRALKDMGNRGLIFLNDYILKRSEEEQALIIAHEIAHLKLNHVSDHWSKEEEDEANDTAKKWLKHD